MPTTIELKQYKCPRCGRDYEDAVRAHFPDKPCKDCTKLMMRIGELGQKLVKEISTIEAEDVTIASQINEILNQEKAMGMLSKGNKDLLNALLTKLGADEERAHDLIYELRKLQKNK